MKLIDLIKQTVSILKPPERLTVVQAAERYHYLKIAGGYTGFYKADRTPYMIEPMNVYDSPNYRMLVFIAPAQTGKTEGLIMNCLLHTIVVNPMDVMVLTPSMSFAKDFSRRRIDRMVRNSPAAHAQLLPSKHDDTIHTKFFKGCMVTVNWVSINELSSKPLPKVLATEVDRYDLDIGGEGHPLNLAKKRTTTFGNSSAMLVAESTPGFQVADATWTPSSKHELNTSVDGIYQFYNQGDRRKYYWQCDDCEEWFTPEFTMLKWQDMGSIEASAETAQLACPHCGTLHHHDKKFEFNNKGRWLRDGEVIDKNGVISGIPRKSETASFILEGTQAAFTTWARLVTSYLNAERSYQETGSEEMLKVFYNTDLGVAYVPKSKLNDRSPEELMSRSVDFGIAKVPTNSRFIVATVDAQRNRFEVQFSAIVATDSIYDIVVIDRFAITKSNRLDADGDRLPLQPPAYIEDWDLLIDEVINRQMELADNSGRKMAVKMVAIDSGGADGTTANAYTFFNKLRKIGLSNKVQLLKGTGSVAAPRHVISYPEHFIKGVKPQVIGTTPILMLNTNKLKDELDARLDRKTTGGMIVFSRHLPKHFYTELTVEKKDGKTGKWSNPNKLRNEAWDLLVYTIGLVAHLQVESLDWSKAPLWAKPINDGNILVIEPEKEQDTFQPVVKHDSSDALKKLGELLG